MRCCWVLFGAVVIAASVPVAADDKVEKKVETADKGTSALYTVVDGTKVDPDTFEGFRTWRAAACDRCHGPNQEGLVGPSLNESLKVLTFDEFKAAVTIGRLEKGMPSFATSKAVMENVDHLYAYLKGRSDGAIKRAKVELLK